MKTIKYNINNNNNNNNNFKVAPHLKSYRCFLRISRIYSQVDNLFTHSLKMSRAPIYFFHVGVLQTLQNGVLSSTSATLVKKVCMDWSIRCVPESLEMLLSRQPSRVSSATRPVAVKRRVISLRLSALNIMNCLK